MTRGFLIALFGLALFGLVACGREPSPRPSEQRMFAPDPGENVGTPEVLMLHPASATPGPDGPTYDGDLWDLGTHRGVLRYPVPVQGGDTITEWAVFLQRDEFTPLGPLTVARLEWLDPVSGLHVGVGHAVSDNRKMTGMIALVFHLEPPHDVDASGSYSLSVAGDGVDGDRAGVAAVHVIRPAPTL